MKNESNSLRCFICKETLPAGRAGERPLTSRPIRPTSSGTIEVLGSVGDRMIALVLDRILLAAILTIPAASLASNWNRLTHNRLLLAASGVLAALLIFLYHVVFEALLKTTPGKAILGLYVRNESRGGNFAAMSIRNLVRVVDSLAFYGVGFLVTLFTARKQRLGDLVARTVVLERKLGWGARAALIVMWVATIAASLWLADMICPQCRPAIVKPF